MYKNFQTLIVVITLSLLFKLYLMHICVDIGSTKADWRYTMIGGEVIHDHSAGFNPIFQQPSELQYILSQLNLPKETIRSVNVYGAGIINDSSKRLICEVFSKNWNVKGKISVESDLLGACRALLGDQMGIVGILGTGSNSCFYDGLNVKDKIPSLGYILGDEGAGSQIGKSVLQSFFYNEMEEELSQKFKLTFNINREEVLQKIYSEQAGSGYLGQFAFFAIEHISSVTMRSIIEAEMDKFILRHLSFYKKYEINQVDFVGSIAFLVQQILEERLRKYGFELGNVIKKPIDAIQVYHSNFLEK